MSLTHDLKIAPEYFDDVREGRKSFEVRRNDRAYRVGDFVRLREFSAASNYTGREQLRRICFILDGFSLGLQPGFVALGLEPLFAAEILLSLVDREGWAISPQCGGGWVVEASEGNGDDAETVELYRGRDGLLQALREAAYEDRSPAALKALEMLRTAP